MANGVKLLVYDFEGPLNVSIQSPLVQFHAEPSLGKTVIVVKYSCLSVCEF